MLAKFHGNILNLSENIVKSFRGATFFDSHCRRVGEVENDRGKVGENVL